MVIKMEDINDRKKIVISGDMKNMLEGCSADPEFFKRLIGKFLENKEKFEGLTEKLCKLERNFVKNINKVLDGDEISVEYLENREIRKNLIKKVNDFLEVKNNYAIILDRNYIGLQDMADYKKAGFLDCTRLEGNNKLTNRPGTKLLEEQINELIEAIPNNANIAIVDDVLFSGSTIKAIANQLTEAAIKKGKNFNFAECIVAISVKNKINPKNLEDIKIKSCKSYASLEDEICSRDFMFGFPQSGKLRADGLSASYFKPFGRTENASIPSGYENTFSETCINFNIGLWTEIDEFRGKKTKISDLGLYKPFIPDELSRKKEKKDMEIVKVLSKAKSFLKTELDRRQSSEQASIQFSK